MQERRTDDRLLCAELVEVSWENGGRQVRRVANLEDISLSGVCLQMEKTIAPMTRIVIRYGDGALVGVVRYSAYCEMGFFIGIQLEEGCRWSTQHYQPKHLLDPRHLVDNAMLRRCLTTAFSGRPN